MSVGKEGAAGPAAAARRAGPAFLLALLAPLAVLLGGRSSAEKSAEAAAADASTSKTRPPLDFGHCVERFAGPFAALSGLEIDSRSGDWWRVLEQADTALLAMGPAASRQVIIASIPDPIDSGLVYFFDVHLQALQSALEVPLPGSGRYNRDRSWLPWDDRSEDADGRKLSEDCRREMPGVVLLRGDPGVMVLLLVGESPTSGLHRGAMERALQAEAALNGNRNRPCSPGTHDAAEGCTRIVGPTFSGAASSLAAALRVRPDPGRGVQIISGTASGPAVPEQLRVEPQAGWGPVTYQATTVPGQAAECAFLYLTRRLGAAEGPPTPGAPRVLETTAVLSESGTEFGSTLAQDPAARSGSLSSPCRWQAEVHLAFPFHVAALRDAYAEQDKRMPAAPDVEQTIARRTSLPVSLHESRTALEAPTPSSKTIFSQDVALSHVLSEISREGVRYLAIEATDPADAIFLAQKVRDVAPDVRLAFLDADALFTHPDFERTLLGSFVISPYPFLGADDFVRSANGPAEPGAAVVPHSHAPFENANAEGTFNAVLAQRGARPDQMKEYLFAESDGDRQSAAACLPLWIATIGHGALVPVATRPGVDCAQTIYGRERVPGQDGLCTAGRSPSQRDADWAAFNALRIDTLRVDPDVTPPRFWHFVYATLVFLLLMDWYFAARTEADLAPPADRPDASNASDRDIDVTVGRTKILFYLSVRVLTLAIGLLYMTFVYWIAAFCYKGPAAANVPVLALATIIALTAAGRFVSVYRRFLVEYRRLGAWRGGCFDGDPPLVDFRGSNRWWRPLAEAGSGVVSWLGFETVLQRQTAVETPYARIRTFRVLVMVIAGGFLVGLFVSLLRDIDFGYGQGGPVPALTLFVLRTLPLANGVSLAAPALLSVLCAYVWAAGRGARLRLAHGLSQMTPDDGLMDGVSTPICSVLHPPPADGAGRRDPTGFGRTERTLLNSIWSPGAGLSYFSALLAICFFPVVLFRLKPPTSLDAQWDTWLLASAMGICGVIVGATLIQLQQYWSALSALLKRIANHPFAGAFKKVLPFVGEDLDAQISRSPDELSRLVACANAYRELSGGSAAAELDLSMRRQLIDEAVQDALHEKSQGNRRLASASEARLGRLLIDAGGAVTSHLLADPGADRAAGWQASGRRWVASLVALLLTRHVRQFRYFLYTNTGCALILLVTTVSYPFEPQRAILTCLWGLTLTVVFSGLAVFVMMSRDTVLSYITGGKPGRLDLNAALLTRVVQWVVVPILIMAATQYPEMTNQAFKWVDPILHSLR